jgi:hypothetical protein
VYPVRPDAPASPTVPSAATDAEGPNGLPPSTTACPSSPYQRPQAAITACCSASVSAMPPPLKTST